MTRIPPILLTLALLLTACAPRAASDGPDIVGHRGASKAAPENTLAAFRYAFDRGADAVEADFRLTADGAVVAMHDETLERTTGDPRAVATVTLAEIRTLDAGSWWDERWAGEPVPTLGEGLAAIPEDKRLLVEIKTGPEILPAVFTEIDASGIGTRQVVIIAFDPDVIAVSKQMRPDVTCYWLTSFERDDTGAFGPSLEEIIATARGLGADGVDMKADPLVIDAAFVRGLHDAGLEAHVWTVNDAHLAGRMAEFGVDSITTGRPDVVRTGLETRYRNLKPQETSGR